MTRVCIRCGESVLRPLEVDACADCMEAFIAFSSAADEALTDEDRDDLALDFELAWQKENG